MSLLAVLKERESKRRALRQDALIEVKRLTSLIRKRYKCEAVYIYGSILSDRFGPHSDIDITIKGLGIEEFFKVYSFLIKESRYKIDLKPFEDLTEDFKARVLSGGVRVG